MVKIDTAATVTNRVEPKRTPVKAHDAEVDIHRRTIRFTGDAHDFNRLRELCDSVLAGYESEGKPLTEVTNRTLRAPAEGER